MVPQAQYVLARRGGRDVAAVTPLPPMMDDPPPAGWVTHIEVDSASEAAERVRAAGGQVVLEGMDSPMGRISVLVDPDGRDGRGQGARPARRRAARQRAGRVGDEPARHADPERAAAFYGAVFGWTTEAFDLGGPGRSPSSAFRATSAASRSSRSPARSSR